MTDSDPDKAVTLLQAARVAVGWKQSQVILALQQRAARDGLPVAGPASLKPMLSAWENGRGRPGAVYRQLFCAIYERSEAELGFEARRSTSSPSPGGRMTPDIGPETVDYFHNVLGEHLRADSLLGPHHLVDVVRAQTELLDQILPGARSSERDRLLLLSCRFNEFTGWLYQDAGEPGAAMAFSDRAMDLALELDDPGRKAYLLMRKCNIAVDQGKPHRAVGLAEAGLRDATRLPPRIRALILTQRARAHAATGELSGCARALDFAYREATRPEATSDDRATYCTEAYILMEAAACWSQLGRFQQATPVFERSLVDWPTAQRRDEGLCRARLASAYAAQGDQPRACGAGRTAVAVVRSALSVRAIGELRLLRTRLTPWRGNSEVSALTQQITALVGG